MELWLRAGELGYADAYGSIAWPYLNGEGVKKDSKKAKHYLELGVVGGDVEARHNLGAFEGKNEGNTSRALKHLMISAGVGYDESLEAIRNFYVIGHATKDDFDRALRASKQAKDETKSNQRDVAAAAYAAAYIPCFCGLQMLKSRLDTTSSRVEPI